MLVQVSRFKMIHGWILNAKQNSFYSYIKKFQEFSSKGSAIFLKIAISWATYCAEKEVGCLEGNIWLPLQHSSGMQVHLLRADSGSLHCCEVCVDEFR